MKISNNINDFVSVDYDLVIVGAGLSGAVIAERFASQENKRVLLVEKRNHIAGNCYDFVDQQGILMNKYGAHLFHTNSTLVWDYVQPFAEWVRWDHKVLAKVDGKLVNVPVNINTVNALLNLSISNENEMDAFLKETQVPFEQPQNSEEVALSRVGEALYEKLFKHYTFKQWEKYPAELDASVMARIPVRNNFDERYFSDKYQALPKKGYTKFVEQVLDHPLVDICLSTDFFEVRNHLHYKHLIFTGKIDAYFKEKGLAQLEYRSIEFTEERFENVNFFQPNSVVNYPGKDVEFTRIVEYKHFLNQTSPHTTIVREVTTAEGEPYYPVPNPKNLALYEEYRKLAHAEKHVFFIGRLASYKYFNMDQAIENALHFYNNHKNII